MTKETTRRDAILKAVATAAAMGTMPRAIGSALATENVDDGDRKQVAPLEVDTLLEGGTIVDGSGSPSFVGDVALRGDRIVAVGQFVTRKAARRIDCRGLVVAPGFCDAHTHCDRTVASPKTRDNTPYIMQGVSTVVTGNCGLGPSDVGTFLGHIDENPPGTNVAHLAAYGPIRQIAMKNAARRPTKEELARLRKETQRAIRAGARGLSTGLAYEWNAHAHVDELVEVCKVAADHGGLYATHIRNEGDEIIEALDEAIMIGSRAQLPVHVSHFKASGKPNWSRMSHAIARIEKARQNGQRVTADQYPYPASSTNLRLYLLPSNKIPGGNRNLKRRMAEDTDFKDMLRKLVQEQLARYPKILFPAKNKTVRQLVKERGEDVLDFAVANQGSTVVCFSMCEENVRRVMQCDFVATGSDGPVPHPRTYGTFPRKFRRYVVEEKLLSLEKAVRQSSGLVADIFGLSDRGYLRVGCYADVVVFDLEKFVDHATFVDYAKPATGVRYLSVNGQATVEDSEATGLRAGRVLRRIA
ncbi:MAG: D-aminoacylase [Planctomycetes bacterium]|nr:D-aminoacylase [Planctomycetota bacterium]